MKIANIELENNVILAPMAGVTDKAFRIITKPFGPALMYTEMVSGKGLLYNSKKTEALLSAEKFEKPLAVQLFGHEPDVLSHIANSALKSGASIIDINMGCPAPKIVNNGDGCALMKSPKLAGDIIKAVCQSTNVPVTVKFRAGWDEGSINAVEFAKTAEENGAAAVTVHGRTREQFYSGKSDKNIIAAVKAAVKIPVIGNGDITDGKTAADMLKATHCDAVMIGRAAQGNPWIFKEILHYIKTGDTLPPPTIRERLDIALLHFDLLLKFKGEKRGVLEGRKHMSWYFKGVNGGSVLRSEVNKAETPQQMIDILTRFCSESCEREHRLERKDINE